MPLSIYDYFRSSIQNLSTKEQRIFVFENKPIFKKIIVNLIIFLRSLMEERRNAIESNKVEEFFRRVFY